MARIILVHGAFNELWGPHELKARWMPALRDGLWHHGVEIADEDVAVCFYGDLFRRSPGTEADRRLEASRPGIAEAMSDFAGADAVAALGQAASDAAFDRTVDMVTIMATEPDLRAQMRARIEPLVDDGTRVLVAHSLGTLLSYMGLCNHPQWPVHTFVTLGSPLASEMMFGQLQPPPVNGQGVWPGSIKRWVNVRAVGDKAAAVPLADRFGDRVEDVLVDNGHRVHAPEPYLNAAPTGAAIAAALLTMATPGASNERHISSWPMWVLGMVIMVDQIDQNVVRGVISQIQDEFHVNDAQIGVLLSAFVLVNGLVTVPAGYLADRWNRSRTIGHTVLLWSFITMLTAAAPTFGVLVGMRALLGFGQAITEPSAASLLSDYYPTSRRGRVFSNQQVMVFIGFGLGIALGGAIGSEFGWRWAFLVVGPPSVLVAFLAYTLKEPKRGAADLMHVDATAASDDTEVEAVKLFDGGFRQFVRDMIRGLRDDFRTIWDITTLRYALVGISALMFTVAGIGAWLPQFHERFSGMTEKQATGMVGALIIFGGIPGVLLGGHFADRFATRVKGARVAIPACCIFVANTFLILSYLPVPAAASVGFQLLGIFAITSAIPALRAGMADAVPAHLRGAGFGAFNLVSILFGAAAAPIIVGALADVWNLRVAFLIVSPPVYVGAWILFMARNHLDADALKIFEAIVRAMQKDQERAES